MHQCPAVNCVNNDLIIEICSIGSYWNEYYVSIEYIESCILVCIDGSRDKIGKSWAHKLC